MMTKNTVGIIESIDIEIPEKNKASKLPCDVGDKVYTIYQSHYDCKWYVAAEEHIVYEILIRACFKPIIRITNSYGRYSPGDFGISLFKRKENAEERCKLLNKKYI